MRERICGWPRREESPEIDVDGRVEGAELRIPYGSLRFREAAEQTWGLNVVREGRRTGYQSSWAPLTADAANPLELSGRLVGGSRVVWWS